MAKVKEGTKKAARSTGRTLSTTADILAWARPLERRRIDAALARLETIEQQARTLHTAAAGQLQALKPGPAMAGRLQAADYVWRGTDRLLRSAARETSPGMVGHAHWALKELLRPDLPDPRRRELRAIADAALLDVEKVWGRLTAYLQRDALAHAAKLHGGRKGHYGPVRQAVIEVLLASEAPPVRMPPEDVLRAVAAKIPGAGPSDRKSLEYGDGQEIGWASFKSLVSEVRASLRQKK